MLIRDSLPLTVINLFIRWIGRSCTFDLTTFSNMFGLFPGYCHCIVIVRYTYLLSFRSQPEGVERRLKHSFVLDPQG